MPSKRSDIDVFLGSREKQDSVMKEYFDNYDKISDADLKNAILDHGYAHAQIQLMLKYIGDVSGKNVIDIGCGQGILSRKLVEGGASQVTALDISHGYLKLLADTPKIRPILASAENIPFEDEFDLAVSVDVMEHVLNLGSFLFCLNRALKIGGMAVIRVPYRENLIPYSPHLGCKYRFVHLRTFNRRSVVDVMRGAGFEVLSTRIDGFFLGRPHDRWRGTQKRVNRYEKFKMLVEKYLKNPDDVAYWPPWFAGIFMRPSEIVIIARKLGGVHVN